MSIFFRKLPNLLTISRLTVSIVLLFLPSLSSGFIILYLYCGISDIADGFLARLFECQSHTGSVLDSISDIVFTVCISVKLIPVMSLQTWMIIWICAIAFIRAAALAVCAVRFHKVTVLHTYSNKAAGFTVFVLLLLFCLMSWSWCVVVCCLTASAAAAEELCRMSFSKAMPEKE